MKQCANQAVVRYIAGTREVPMQRNIILIFVFFIFTGTSWGVDNRHAVYRETSETQKVGLLKSAAGQCTGTIVGSNYVLTAAHCVYNQITNRPAAKIYFQPAHNSQDSDTKYRFFNDPIYFYSFAEEVYIAKEYLQEVQSLHKQAAGNRDKLKNGLPNDVAIVKFRSLPGVPSLASRFGKVNFIGRAEMQSKYSNYIDSYLYGYPEDKKPAFSLWRTNCTIDIEHWQVPQVIGDCVSARGNSGGPIFTPNGSVYGVLSAGGKSYLLGTSFPQTIWQEMQKIIHGDNSDLQEFVAFSTPTQAFHAVKLKNSCRRELHVVLRTLSEQGEWLNSRWFHLAPGESTDVVYNHSRNFYFYANDDANEFVWWGKNKQWVRSRRSSKLTPFLKYRIGDQWQYFYLPLGCGGV